MKKFLISVLLIVIVYFVIAGVLTTAGVCPKYINLMPKVVGSGVENIKGPNDPQTWHILCPFVEKVY